MFVITADQVRSRTSPDIAGRTQQRLDAEHRAHLLAPVGRAARRRAPAAPRRRRADARHRARPHPRAALERRPRRRRRAHPAAPRDRRGDRPGVLRRTRRRERREAPPQRFALAVEARRRRPSRARRRRRIARRPAARAPRAPDRTRAGSSTTSCATGLPQNAAAERLGIAAAASLGAREGVRACAPSSTPLPALVGCSKTSAARPTTQKEPRDRAPRHRAQLVCTRARARRRRRAHGARVDASAARVHLVRGAARSASRSSPRHPPPTACPPGARPARRRPRARGGGLRRRPRGDHGAAARDGRRCRARPPRRHPRSPTAARPGEHRTVAPGARREVLRGGLTIGVLERLAAAGSIIAGFPRARDRRRGQGRRPIHRARGGRGARAVHHRHVREPHLGCAAAWPCTSRSAERVSLVSAGRRSRGVPRGPEAPCATRRDASRASERAGGTATPPRRPGSRSATGTRAPAVTAHARARADRERHRAAGTASANGGASRSAPLAASGMPRASESRAGPRARSRSDAVGRRRRARSSPSTTVAAAQQHRRRRCPACPRPTLRQTCMP